MAKMTDPRELFLHELGDVLYAENVPVKTLPKLAQEATDEQLRAGFEAHLAETKRHVKNVEQAFSALGEKLSYPTGQRRRVTGTLRLVGESSAPHAPGRRRSESWPAATATAPCCGRYGRHCSIAACVLVVVLRERADVAAANGVSAVIYRFDLEGSLVALIHTTQVAQRRNFGV